MRSRPRLSLLVLLLALALALALAGCGPAHREYRAGDYSLTSDRLSGGWSYLTAHLDQPVSCIKWSADLGGNAAGVGCLPGQLFKEAPQLVSSVGSGGGWSVARFQVGAGHALCVKWEGQNADAGDISCFKEEGHYSGAPARIESKKASGGWSVASVRVPGQRPRLCYKWEVDNGKSGGGGVISCLIAHNALPSGAKAAVQSYHLAKHWSLAEVALTGEPSALCLKWEGDDSGEGYCFLEEASYHGQHVLRDEIDFGGSWSTVKVAIPGYDPLRCLRYSTSDQAGMSCWPAVS